MKIRSCILFLAAYWLLLSAASAKVPAFSLEVSSIDKIKISEELVECVASGIARIAFIIPAPAKGERLTFYGKLARMVEIIAENCHIIITRGHSDLPDMEEQYEKLWNESLWALQSSNKFVPLVITAQEADVSISKQVVTAVSGQGFAAVRTPKPAEPSVPGIIRPEDSPVDGRP